MNGLRLVPPSIARFRTMPVPINPFQSTDVAIRKAAVLVASLPLEEAAHLTRSLSEQQLERLADAVARLEEVGDKEQAKVAGELSRSPVTSRRSQQIDSELMEYRQRMDDADPAIVCVVLREELPQTIALLLSEMSAKAAAAVLRKLSTDRQIAVAKRMARLRPGNDSIVVTLLRGVSQSVMARSQPLRQSAGGEAFLAHVVNCTDRATERALLENLGQEDRGLVDRLLQRMYLLKDSRRPQFAEDKSDTDRTTRRAG